MRELGLLGLVRRALIGLCLSALIGTVIGLLLPDILARRLLFLVPLRLFLLLPLLVCINSKDKLWQTPLIIATAPTNGLLPPTLQALLPFVSLWLLLLPKQRLR